MRPNDFASYLLAIGICNLLLYFAFYIIMKVRAEPARPLLSLRGTWQGLPGQRRPPAHHSCMCPPEAVVSKGHLLSPIHVLREAQATSTSVQRGEEAGPTESVLSSVRGALAQKAAWPGCHRRRVLGTGRPSRVVIIGEEPSCSCRAG